MADLYATLGVSKGADKDEIKNSYRKLAKQYHPDKNPGDEAAEKKFKEITAAYEILKDDDKRAAYDRYGDAAFNGGMGGGAGGFDFNRAGAGAFSDIFEDLFGSMGMGGGGRAGGSQQAAANRGSDLRYNMEVTLEDAYHGSSKTIKVNTFAACEPCGGSGSSEKNATTNCNTCGGHGRVRMRQGFFVMERTCNSCNGTGQIVKNPCKSCGGEGRAKKSKTLSVNIPKGVEEGMRIRLNGEGEAGIRGGKPGDLYIFVGVQQHPLFERDDAHLHCAVPITFATAALGGSVEIPTLDGNRAKVNIPAGTQNNHQFRLKTKGMPQMRSSQYGDLYVHARVEVPVNLTKKQQELLREFEGLTEKGENPETESFLDKVKQFLTNLKNEL